MLDLFCGSGSVGIEALSRGSIHVDFVDLDVRTVVRNVRALGVDSSVNIYRRDALKAPRWLQKEGKSYGFIFIGPPYEYPKTEEVLTLIDNRRLLEPGGSLMVEHRKGTDFPGELESLERKKTYHYGQTLISLYEYGNTAGEHGSAVLNGEHS